MIHFISQIRAKIRLLANHPSLELKLIILTTVMFFFVLLPTAGFLIFYDFNNVQDSYSDKALNIGRVIAQVPSVQKAIVSERPSDELQPFAERWRKATGASFIVISNMNQVRLSHTLPEKVGTPMASLYREPVLQGREYVYTAKGSLAPSLRANVPIYGYGQDKQIGFVSVGFELEEIYRAKLLNMWKILLALFSALVLCIFGANYVARNVKRSIFGLEPREIAAILKERLATLEAIREGVIAVDAERRIRVFNRQAAEILGLNELSAHGLLIDDVLPNNTVGEVIKTRLAVYDEEQKVGDVIIWASTVPIIVEDTVTGAVMSFRDRTEIVRMAEEITGVNRFVDGMRAQAHEFKNKLHTISGLIQLKRYEEAVNLITENESQNKEVEFLSCNIKEPLIFALLAGKLSTVREQGIHVDVHPGSTLSRLPKDFNGADMVLILGNLLENAIEAVRGAEQKNIRLSLIQQTDGIALSVYNSGPWISQELFGKIYQRGVSTKGANRGYGLALAAEKIRAAGGTICHRNIPGGGVEFNVFIPDLA